MHKFATVYKAAMAKHAKDWKWDEVLGKVVRADPPESVVRLPESPYNPQWMRWYKNRPGFFGKDLAREEAVRDTAYAMINPVSTALFGKRRLNAAAQQGLEEAKNRLNAQPKATWQSQIGSAIKDQIKNPIKGIKDAWQARNR